MLQEMLKSSLCDNLSLPRFLCGCVSTCIVHHGLASFLSTLAATAKVERSLATSSPNRSLATVLFSVKAEFVASDFQL